MLSEEIIISGIYAVFGQCKAGVYVVKRDLENKTPKWEYVIIR